MKKTIFTAILAAAAFSANAQLMYKISGNGLEKPSYVVGTHQLAPAAMAQLIDGVSEALNGTDQVFGELSTDAATADASQTVKAASTLPSGKTIQQILSADELKGFNAFLMKTQGQDLRNRVLAEKVERKTPAALTKDMKIWLYLANHRGTYDPTSQIDSYFVKLAKKNNMPVFGFETVEEYANAVYRGTTEQRQKEQLVSLINHQDFYQRQMDNILNAYMDQNLDAIERALEEKVEGNGNPTAEEIQAQNERIARWSQKIQEVAKKTPTLFVVGVEKLPGQQGLLQQLSQAGYTVEGLK